jgi:histidine ammonia-lyase
MKITEHKIVEDQVVLNGASLSIEEVMRVAAHHAVVRLDEKAVDRVKWEREMLEKIARQDVPIYGVTTGVGANRDVRIAPEDIANFQNRILISHCIGVGPYHPEVVVRAIMVTRANALARGGSGVQPEILLRHVEFLNKGRSGRSWSHGGNGPCLYWIGGGDG